MLKVNATAVMPNFKPQITTGALIINKYQQINHIEVL
jgi:hypothetical protein